jgi:hypothetical protein
VKTGFDESGRRIAVCEPAENQQLDQMDNESDANECAPIFNAEDPTDISRLDDEGQAICRAYAAEAIWKFAILIADEKKPKRAIYSVLYVVGAGQFVGGSGTAIAKSFGVSKQALFQQGKRLLYSLGLRKAPLAKNEGSKKTYSEANHRNTKLKEIYER